ncbi:hypothetical protein Selin_0894 [Desulfurispirillum indicum S5]|uniref:Lipoprotein n=1 Tax=Desulfurispirillum indicum (strain ATCC BAA-1389 / DSM 22839 / S5) TaxID=653733 RepID=E6W2Q0_DESIS|nr:hypothetical protein [Desulfurispirillum indicum]ADU65634.1 hypothetical protein Selin_0894 [Desulfurispirillum indicum S5]
MKTLLLLMILLAFLSGSCSHYSVTPPSAVMQRCAEGIGVPPVRNDSQYHEQSPRLRDALIGQLNRQPGMRYSSNARCQLQCVLLGTSQHVSRRDAYGTALSEDAQFSIECELVEDGLVSLSRHQVAFTDDTFIQTDARSRYENMAESVINRVLR